MRNDQKSKCLSCTVTEPHNFKTFVISPTWFHTLQLRYIVILAIAFSLHNIKILPTHQLDFFLLSNPALYFLEIARNYVSIIITIINNITVLVSHSVICFGYFMAMSHAVSIRRLLQLSTRTSHPY